MQNKINLEKSEILKVDVICNSKKEEIELLEGRKLKVRLKAVPVEGKANKRLIELFKENGYRVEILKGKTSHHKVIKVL
ncbi:MAG: DUF167 domain-containing protein [archaeon]